MNKIYKVIFSRRLGAFVVASELTKAHSKDSNSSCVDERRGSAGAQHSARSLLHRALSFLQSPRLSLRPLVVSLLMGGALGLATPALAQVTYTDNQAQMIALKAWSLNSLPAQRQTPLAAPTLLQV